MPSSAPRGWPQNPELRRRRAITGRSRAAVRCRQPEKAAALLRARRAHDETLYGMLAAEQLGTRLPEPRRPAPTSPRPTGSGCASVDNVRTAVALAEIGRDTLADEVLRHQAQDRRRPGDYAALTRLARDLGLPSTQLWHGATTRRSGARARARAALSRAQVAPTTGWKVDPALAYRAHAAGIELPRQRGQPGAGARG